MIKPAQRTTGFKYAIRDIVAAAERLEREGRDVIHLNIGDPQAFGYRPPDAVIDRITSAANFKFTGYAHSAGLFEAREAVAEYATNLGSLTTPDDVVITSGASEAAELALTALIDPGDEVLLPAPGYPIYPAIVRKLGGAVRNYYLNPANDWQPDADAFERAVTVKTKAIVLINPNNPTGSITADSTTRRILKIAAENEIAVISDEVYRELCFETAPTPASRLAEEIGMPLITLESLSKTHMLTGYRVGWMRFTNSGEIGDLLTSIVRLASGRLCSPTISQYAVKECLTTDNGYLRSFMSSIRSKRDLAVEELNHIPGISCSPPQAAFYLMVKADGRNGSDDAFVMSLLRETGVLVVPGSGFGCNAADGYFRMVYLADVDQLRDAIDRIRDHVKGRSNELPTPELITTSSTLQ